MFVRNFLNKIPRPIGDVIQEWIKEMYSYKIGKKDLAKHKITMWVPLGICNL